MAIDDKERQEATVSVTATDPDQPKKKQQQDGDDKVKENLEKARKELKDETELVRSPFSAGDDDAASGASLISTD